MVTSVVPEAVILKAPPSKDSEERPVIGVPLRPWYSSTSRPAKTVLVSVSVSAPQENLPPVASQRSLEVAAVSQSVKPEPLTPPSKEAEPSTSSLVEINRSEAWVRKLEVVVLVPNLE